MLNLMAVWPFATCLDRRAVLSFANLAIAARTARLVCHTVAALVVKLFVAVNAVRRGIDVAATPVVHRARTVAPVPAAYLHPPVVSRISLAPVVPVVVAT